jgi:transposase
VPRQKRRSFTREFKLAALSRMATTTSIVGLAAELGIERKLLYCWQDAYANGGSVALRRAGRPGRANTLDAVEAPVPAGESETARAQRQIEALQRKIGQQQLDLDFFRAALRQVREQRRKKGVPGETVSTR